MHTKHSEQWRHDHDFLPADQARNEQRTRLVIALTSVMMIAEIAAGTVYNSMALLADGWHMASHASALGLAAFAYWYARHHRDNDRYSFGTWKVGVLGGFSSAVLLGVIALLVAWESLGRLFQPRAIGFDEAIAVATLGLLVNLVSAWMLRGHEGDGHHGFGEHHHHSDHNLRAAYLHVLADALTSVTAILGLTAAKLFGWGWMDPAVGILGSLVIARWSYGLLRDTSRVLLDGAVPADVLDRIKRALEAPTTDIVADLHVWHVGPGKLAAVVSVVSDAPKDPAHYHRILAEEFGIAHMTVEVRRCPDHHSAAA